MFANCCKEFPRNLAISPLFSAKCRKRRLGSFPPVYNLMALFGQRGLRGF